MGDVTHAPGRRRRQSRRWVAVAIAAALMLPVTACGGGPLDEVEDTAADVAPDGSPVDGGDDSQDSGDGGDDGDESEDDGDGGDETGDASYAMDTPGPFQPPLERSDVLISASETLPDDLVEKVSEVKGVRAATQLGMASLSIEGRTLTVAAVDAGEFRRFTPVESARAQFVWDRLAGGELAVDPTVPKRLIDKGDMIKLGTRDDSPSVHVGAYAPLAQRSAGLSTVPIAQAVVNRERGEQLGLPEGNALLVSTDVTPSEIKKQLKGALPPKTTMQILALEFRNASQTAVLAGTSVSDAIGKFTYTNGPDGTINPDQGWVNAYIRTEEVPILGEVTCNKAYLPQLRGALTEIVQLGLAS